MNVKRINSFLVAIKSPRNWWAILSLFCVFTSVCLQAQQQDFQFNQFTVTPLLINPALTGKINQDFRLTAIHRSQWRSTNTPFTTTGASADMNFNNKLGVDRVGIGALFVNDQQGEGGIFVNNSFALSLAVHKVLDAQRRHQLSFGMQGGGTSRNLNNGNNYFASQIDPKTFQTNTALPSGENFSGNAQFLFNLNTGLFWDFTISDKFEWFTGFSVYNLTQPSESYLNTASANKIPMMYIINPGFVYNVTSNFMLEPSVLIAKSGGATISNYGLQGKYEIFSKDEKHNTIFTVGTWYRSYGAMVALAGVGFNNYRVNFSYEFAVSDINNVTKMLGSKNSVLGAFEISLVYLGFLNRALPGTMTVPSRIF
jgi:type IX secretion system PorP/SprF family membrane protein